VDEASLSLKRFHGGGLGGGAPSLGTLEDMLECLRIRASLSVRAPFLPRGTWYVGGSYNGDFER